MRISVFSGARDNFPKVVDCTWEKLQDILGEHRYGYAEKLAVPAFSPAEYPQGATRATKNVSRLWLFVADVDHVDQPTAVETLRRVHAGRIAGIAYSTWSHGEDPWRFRVVNPLSRAVTPEEWPRFWSTMNAAYGGVCDPKCVDPARLYFGPYAPAGTEAKNFRHVFDGEPIDVDKVLSASRVVASPAATGLFTPQAPMALGVLSRDVLKKYAQQLSKRSNDYIAHQGEALLQVVNGDAFAEPGDRDNAIFRLASLLGERFTSYDAPSIAKHFAPSLALMAQQGADCPTVDDVLYKLERAQGEERARQQAALDAEEAKRTSRLREAWGNNCRASPYTPEEIASFGREIDKRWIIQRDRSFYLFFNGAYKGPYTESEMANIALVHLAPATTAGVELQVRDEDGKPFFKPTKQLVEEYGTVADSVVTSLSAPKTSYDEKERCIIEAPCQLRAITPKFHEDIDQWMRILCWNNPLYYENLKTWLAVVTRLDFICSALFLTGKKSVGKSMLAQGISRCWTTRGPTSLKSVFDTFNDALSGCPFTFADEHLPTDFRGYTKFEDLREHIAQTERAYKRKYLPTSKMLGATRTMIAAHTKAILRTPQTLDDDEIHAIIERFFHIATNPEAAVYLANLRPNTFERGWVYQDKIAEHVLWLRDNHQHQTQGRFYVHVPDEGLFRALSTQSGAKGGVCQWLVSYLLEPKRFHDSAYSNLYVRVKNGQLLANARGPSQTWDTYVGKNERCPIFGVLSRAIKELSVGERVKLNDRRGQRTNYRVIEMNNLLSWVEDNDFCEGEALLEALKTDTKES